jgi:hypothetical protein
VRYRDAITQLDFDSRQDEDEAACGECGEIWLTDFLEPCPRGVVPVVGAVCSECAAQLRSATFGEGADRTPEQQPAWMESDDMKRWINRLNDDAEVPAIDAFLADVEAVCRKHGFSLSHEDGQGAFEVEEFSESNIAWLKDAHDARQS